MNEIVLLICNWLPVFVESGVFILLLKFLSKELKKHFSTPNKLIKEIQELRSSNAALNRQVALVLEENHKIQRENHRLMMKEKGIRDYDKEEPKN